MINVNIYDTDGITSMDDLNEIVEVMQKKEYGMVSIEPSGINLYPTPSDDHTLVVILNENNVPLFQAPIERPIIDLVQEIFQSLIDGTDIQKYREIKGLVEDSLTKTGTTSLNGKDKKDHADTINFDSALSLKDMETGLLNELGFHVVLMPGHKKTLRLTDSTVNSVNGISIVSDELFMSQLQRAILENLPTLNNVYVNITRFDESIDTVSLSDISSLDQELRTKFRRITIESTDVILAPVVMSDVCFIYDYGRVYTSEEAIENDTASQNYVDIVVSWATWAAKYLESITN